MDTKLFAHHQASNHMTIKDPEPHHNGHEQRLIYFVACGGRLDSKEGKELLGVSLDAAHIEGRQALRDEIRGGHAGP